MAKMNHYFLRILVIVACVCAVHTKEETGPNKRILLSDPSFVQQQLEHMQSELQSLQAEVSVLTAKNVIQETTIQQLSNVTAIGGHGAVYVHWARTSCSEPNTELVYAGFAGGSLFTSPGGAAETVCMPSDPIWGPHKNDVETDPAYMYGAEYDTTNIFGPGSYNEDVPCAVCRSTVHSSSIMIPGRTQCYGGWSEAYNGLLVASCAGCASASQYVCLDGHPEYVQGGSENKNGRVFHAVYTACGSLPCPPYENHKLLPCVVCTK